jgi:dihydroxyacetone kinase-like predicted kinase
LGNCAFGEEFVTQTHLPEATQTAPPPKWLQCNGRQLQKIAYAALTWLEQNHQHVNSLNVFPVPDGDTGTNMLLTMKSAYGRVQNSEEEHVGKVAEQLAHGALMGARGNSGVILSQIWRGLAKGLKGKETFDAADLAHALQAAADTAYSGVMKPVEGTILTVIREGASEAADAAKKSRDLRFLLERVLERCKQALERTPDQLAILKQAGVVDSGGQGLVYILEGMLNYVYGKMNELMFTAVPSSNHVATNRPMSAQELAMPDGGSIENPYDVQFILMGENLNVTEVRNRIDAMGDSTVVVGDETTIKVHIHVKDPGVPLSYGISLGHITDVVVENMQMQMEEIVQAAGDGHGGNGRSPRQTHRAAGPGRCRRRRRWRRIGRNLSAAWALPLSSAAGRPTTPASKSCSRPSRTCPPIRWSSCPTTKTSSWPPKPPAISVPKHVAVVPTKTAPQGLSAMLALNPDGELDETGRCHGRSVGASFYRRDHPRHPLRHAGRRVGE